MEKALKREWRTWKELGALNSAPVEGMALFQSHSTTGGGGHGYQLWFVRDSGGAKELVRIIGTPFNPETGEIYVHPFELQYPAFGVWSPGRRRLLQRAWPKAKFVPMERKAVLRWDIKNLVYKDKGKEFETPAIQLFVQYRLSSPFGHTWDNVEMKNAERADLFEAWLKKQGVSTTDFPPYFSEYMGKGKLIYWKGEFQAADYGVTAESVLDGKSVEGWYQTFFNGKAFNAYIEAL